MTTCIAVGDPHFMISNVIDAEMLITKVNSLVDRLKPDFVVLLGDILHTHEKIHVVPFRLATRFITELAEKVPVFLIIGNHDYCFGGDVKVKMWDGSVKFARDILIGDKLVGDDYTSRTVKRVVYGQGKMFKVKQYNRITNDIVSEYTVSASHILTLVLPTNILYWDNNNNVYVSWFTRDSKLCSHSSGDITEMNTCLKSTAITNGKFDITVTDYLLLNKFVQSCVFGYSRNVNVQDPNEFLQLRNPKYYTQLYSLIIEDCSGSDEYEYFGWELKGNSPYFLLEDGTVTHNCNNQQFLTDAHAFNAFKSIANVTVCDKPLVYETNGLKFVFCPYVPPERFQEALGTLEDSGIRWDDATCIFAHQEFYGCSFNPVATSTEGDIWPDDFPLVVSGHIHNEQRLQPNIYYPGSSMQHAFGETSNKTVAQLTFNKGKKFKLKKVDLELRKKKIVYVDVDCADKFEPEPNTLTKLVIKGSSEQFKVFRRGQAYKDLQKLGIAISFSPNAMTEYDNNNENGTKKVKKSVIEILYDLVKDGNKYLLSAFKELERS
jgi:DNA repair exonuclease SbcCD nuclease subunit